MKLTVCLILSFLFLIPFVNTIEIKEIETRCDLFDCYTIISSSYLKTVSLKLIDMDIKKGDINFQRIEKMSSDMINISGKIKGASQNYWGIKGIWESTWWNSSWNMKKNITITSDALTVRDFDVVDINITGLTLVTNECYELRIVNDTENEIQWQIIDDSGKALGNGNEWCKMRFLSNKSFPISSTVNYSVYYNNAGATNPNYGMYIVYDNFNDNSVDVTKWSKMEKNGGTIQETGNIILMTRGTDYGVNLLLNQSTDYNFSASTITVQWLSLNDANVRATIFMRWGGVITGNYPDYHYIVGRQQTTPGAFDVLKRTNTWDTSNTTNIGPASYPKWYWLEAETSGSTTVTIKAYENDTFYVSYSDSSSPFANGYSGLYGWLGATGSKAYYDNFCIINSSSMKCHVYNTSLTTSLGSEEIITTTTTTTTTIPEIKEPVVVCFNTKPICVKLDDFTIYLFNDKLINVVK